MFVQQFECATDDAEGLIAILDEWSTDAIGVGTAIRGEMSRDVDDPSRFVVVVHFESAESAQQNSDRPETGEFAQRFGALCTDGPTFRNLNVVGSWPA
jgi:quinol monooxygenase YgiN